VLKWRTCWGTYWEPIRNLEGTSWKHIGKQGKKEKKNPFRPPNLKGIEARHTRSLPPLPAKLA